MVLSLEVSRRLFFGSFMGLEWCEDSFDSAVSFETTNDA